MGIRPRVMEHGDDTQGEVATRKVTDPDTPFPGDRGPTGPLPVTSDRYVIRELIARGGMGEVHLAWDRQLQREVALKTLRMDLNDDTLAPRFVFEARLSGQLEHPNIVPVHDFGTGPDGQPFYTMRWIRGRSLAQLITAGKLPSAVERLDVFRKICDAIAFAHARGVLHRDLKPSNVMVGEFGEVMVLDWGIARMAGARSDGAEPGTDAAPLDDELLESPHTRAGLIVGTPVFMAPEVLRGQRDGLDARIDVYALGVMLYKLLTGVLPFTGDHALKAARAGRFVPPRRHSAQIDRELDAVVCKAMAKDPAQRYANAEELRRDVQAYLEGGDVLAYPRSIVGRALRWARHNRRIVAPVIATVAVGAIALIVSAAIYTRELGASRDQAIAAEHAARIQAAKAETASALTWTEAGRFEDARSALHRVRTTLSSTDDSAFVEVTEAYLLHEWAPPLLTWSFDHDAAGASSFLVSDDGEQLVLSTADAAVRIIRLPEGVTTAEYLPASPVTAFGFVDGQAAVATVEPERAVLVEVASGREIAQVRGDQMRIVAVHADGHFIEVTQGATRHRLDAVTNKLSEWVLPVDALLETWTRDGAAVGGHQAPTNRIPDEYVVWDTRTGEVLHRLVGVRRLVLDPTGRWMVVAINGGTELRALSSGTTLHHWSGLDPRAVLFSPDGNEVVFDHSDGQLSIWSVPGFEQLARQRFRASLHSVTKDGDLVVADAHSWSVIASTPPRAGRHKLDGELIQTASSADGLLVCVASKDGRVRLMEPWTGTVLRTFHGAPAPSGSRGCAISGKSTRLAQADRDGVLRLWSLEDGTKLSEITGNELVYAAHFLDEDRVLASFVGGEIGVWHVETGERLTTFEGGPAGAWGLDLSGDGQLVLASGRAKDDPVATLWNVQGGSPRLQIADALIGYGAALSFDGRTMAVGTHSGRAVWWSTATGVRTDASTRSDSAVLSVAFSPDGTLVFGSTELGTLEVWHASDGSLVASLPLFHRSLGHITALPGTRTVMTMGGLDEVRLLDLDRPRVVAASTPAQSDRGFVIPEGGERALQLGRLASMRGDWTAAANFFAKAVVGGATPGHVEWARAAWAAGDRVAARRLLEQAAAAGEILVGSARAWANAE